MPAIAAATRANIDVDFICANQGEAADTIRNFLLGAQLELETVVTRISGHYSAVGMPTTLFINADGSQTGIHIGEISSESVIDEVTDLQSRNRKIEP
jgi:hypothetical protein